MNDRRLRVFPVIVLVIVAMVLASVAVSARPLSQDEVSEDLEFLLDAPPAGPNSNAVVGDDADENGFSGAVPAGSASVVEFSETTGAPTASAAPASAELQPDDNGYAGSVDRSANPVASPSEKQASSAPNWDGMLAGPQADQDGASDGPNGQVESPDGWSSFFYLNVAGTTLRPRDSSSGWDYGGVGCVSLANGSQLLNINLDVPNGSRIDYLRIYYYDTSGNNGRAWVTIYNGAGSYSDITTVTSAGNGGYGTALSSYVGHVVDTFENAYVLNWSANQTGSSMALCGMRVAYRLPT